MSGVSGRRGSFEGVWFVFSSQFLATRSQQRASQTTQPLDLVITPTGIMKSSRLLTSTTSLRSLNLKRNPCMRRQRNLILAEADADPQFRQIRPFTDHELGVLRPLCLPAPPRRGAVVVSRTTTSGLAFLVPANAVPTDSSRTPQIATRQRRSIKSMIQSLLL